MVTGIDAIMEIRHKETKVVQPKMSSFISEVHNALKL